VVVAVVPVEAAILEDKVGLEVLYFIKIIFQLRLEKL
jgi:hypothetical protein